MANEDHLKIFRKGVEEWNRWRERESEVLPDLSGVDLGRGEFHGINFYKTKLTKADLSNANFFKAIFHTANLIEANLSGSFFFEASFVEADLSMANLSTAKLFGADLKWAKLSGAILTDTDLTRTQALDADFTGANFTGACLKEWHTNSDTLLSEVKCEFFYWDRNGGYNFLDRCPSSRIFLPGEFTKLLQKTFRTVDLIFRNGVDWEAFSYSFRRVQVEQGDEELAIQSIENKGDGVLIVRLKVSSNANYGKIEGDFMQGYELARKVLDERYRAELDSKSGEIYRQQGYINQLFLLLNQKQEHNQEIEKLMEETPKVNQTFNFHAPVHGFSGYTETFNNFSPEQKQNLAEAAAEIQQLLNQLAQAHPTSESAIVEAVYQEIKRNPTLKARLLGALKAGGLEALKAIFAHPVFSISAETVKGWLEAE